VYKYSNYSTLFSAEKLILEQNKVVPGSNNSKMQSEM